MKNENQKATKKLSGFYIALCCCVLAIGIAGYLTEKHTEDSAAVISNEIAESTAEPVFSNDFTSVGELSMATLPPAADVEEINPETETENQEAAELEDYAVDNPDVEGSAITVSSEQPVFILPVSGEILEGFTDVLSYNNALSDWRAHGGIDISAEKGCSVQSVSQGVIEKIYDNAMGSCVEISHAGGFVSRYMGLESVENLTEGKEIKSGEVIGTVGECKGENVTQPHLHFEMEKDGGAVNPLDYLPEQ